MEKAELFFLPSINPDQKIRFSHRLTSPQGLMRYKNILKAGPRAWKSACKKGFFCVNMEFSVFYFINFMCETWILLSIMLMKMIIGRRDVSWE